MTLNLNKSHYIIFKRNKIIPINTPKLNINNSNLEVLETTKFLGLTLQSNLKWDTHIKILANKLHKYASIIFLTRNYLDKNSLKQIYTGLIYSSLVYANIIWSKSPMKHIKPLIIAQKRIIRTIMYRNRLHHTNSDFHQLGILKFQDVVTYFASLFVFKSIHEISYPINYFHLAGNDHYHNLRNTQNLRPPIAISTQSQRSPSFYCCTIWNDLPENIKSRPSVASFRFAMRRHLLDSYLS